MFTSRSISSSKRPRRDPMMRFLRTNLAANSLPDDLSIHRRTVANWPLEKRKEENY